MERRKIILIVGIAVAVALLFPTPHVYTVTEPVYGYVTKTARDLVKTLDCDGVLSGGYCWNWDLYDLPDGTLYIVVDVSSTDDVEITIKDKTGVIYDVCSKEQYYHVYGVGPVLEVEVYNPPGILHNPDAVISGEIKIYHEYTCLLYTSPSPRD